jgi:alpha-mannosidase
MTLSPEWRPRVEHWQRVLKDLWYQSLAPVSLEAAFTYDQLSPAEARSLDYAPIASGTPWGARWQYAWFRARIPVPEAAAGRSLYLNAGDITPQWGGDPYGEWRILIDGHEIGSRDWAHVTLRIADVSEAGQVFDFLAEAFGGPTRVGAGGGPALPGISPLPVIGATQRKLPEVTVGLWREDVFQLWLDIQTLFELRDLLDPDSLRVDEIDAGLRDATLLANPELPEEAMRASVAAARERLRPLLACRNGSTAPMLHCVGHSHLDVVYQWPFSETERKVARTFANQLRLLEDYPEYRYLQSMPVLYETAKRLHPDIYGRVRAAVGKGGWIAEGGMWTEADSNLPCGESLIRQFLYGTRFFREEFGVESVFAWLPDIFGYSGSLPQIMAGCGMRWFGSSKIYGLNHGGDPFPYTSFWWEGIDGTRILSHFPMYYGVHTHPKSLQEQWKHRPQKDGLKGRMVLYGHSDGGGGCERSHLEFLRRSADLEGLPRTCHTSPDAFFTELEKTAETLPVYVGEIYFPLHRGTYTTQARLKKLNRLCEAVLHDAELWSALAHQRRKAAYPVADLESTWKKVLFNQFHDILPGSCVRRAAEEAEALYAEALSEAETLVGKACAALVGDDPAGATVFNSLPFAREALVALPDGVSSEGLPAQTLDGKVHVLLRLPALGARRISTDMSAAASPPARAECRVLDNGLVRASFDDRGALVSFVDLADGRELAAAPLNDLKLYRDIPDVYEAWDLDPHYELQEVAQESPVDMTVSANGPLLAALTVTRRIGDSELRQEIRLLRGSRRLEFHTRVDWRERHKVLKACFPLALHSPEALHEIQFGHLKRPTHRSRPYDRDRYEVCQQRWSALAESTRGVALLNDCKYGISTHGACLNLTLLRASLAPDDQADLGVHEFSYALMPWQGSFAGSGVVQAAMDFNTPPRVLRGAGDVETLFSVDAPGAILEHIKRAEDGDDWILRLYESTGGSARCRISTPLPLRESWACDLLENKLRPLTNGTEGIVFDLRPFQILTLRLANGDHRNPAE